MLTMFLTYMRYYARCYVARLLMQRGALGSVEPLLLGLFILGCIAAYMLWGDELAWISLDLFRPMYLDLRLGTRLRYLSGSY